MDLSRRNFLAQGAVAAGAVAVVGQVTSGAAAAAAPAESATAATWWGGAPVESEPFVVYIRNAAKGEVSVLIGENEVTYVDRALVGRLQRAVRRTAS